MPRRTQERHSRLQTKCRELLAERKHYQSYSSIARDLEMSHTFLVELAAGKTGAANAAYLERIYTYFTGREIGL